MSDSTGFDLSQVSAEEFARFVAATSDEQLAFAIRAVGTGKVLDRVFEHMRVRFRPERAAGVDAEVEFLLRDEDLEHAYTVRVDEKACVVRRDAPEAPRVSLRFDVLSFVKLVTGCAEGPALFLSGRLKVSGDLVFALKLLGLFDRPRPS